eukprot:COSAG02_NODE_8777_length_2449_cov_2.151489_2_plen_65_part_00
MIYLVNSYRLSLARCFAGRGRSGRLPTQKVHHILENSRYDVQVRYQTRWDATRFSDFDEVLGLG